MMRAANYVVGVFRDAEAARSAIDELRVAGFGAHDVDLLMPDLADSGPRTAETKAAEGTATGAVLGGLLGGLGGWLVGLGAIAIPVVGPVVAAGAFATMLAGAGAGLGVGAIAGGLIGLGIPEEEARWYEQEVEAGNTLVAVRGDGSYDAAREILRRHGAYDIEAREPRSLPG